MTRFVTVASIAVSLFAVPAIAQEAPTYRGDYQPPVVRDGHAGASEFGGAHAIEPASKKAPVAVNPDPMLQNYSANITQFDLRSGK